MKLFEPLGILLMLTPSFECGYNATLIKSITKLLDTLLDNYDQKFRPGHGESPLVVAVHISVLSMGPISEKDMEFTMDCYFRQKWTDERLKFDGPLQNLSIASKVLKDIWRPDTYIRNGRQSYLHTLTMPNILLRVRNDGQVYVSQRLTIRARCPMFFRKFPMDTQACPLQIGSLGYTSADVIYQWNNLTVGQPIQLSQYKLLRQPFYEENITDIQNPEGETLSTLKALFILERQQGYYVLQIYTPCTLIVVMSWVSFWINKEASPARVGLGIMTVLTMSTLGLGGKTELPKISYSTAMDMYIVTCFGFVFASLVEYAVVNFAYMFHLRKTIEQMKEITTAMTGAGRSNEVEYQAMEVGTGEGEEPSEALVSPALMELSTASETMARCNEPLMENMQGRTHDQAFLKPTTIRNRRLNNSNVIRESVYEVFSTRARRKLKPRNPMEMVDKIDSVAKWLFPGLYLFFNVFYWWAFLYWIPDEIDSILYCNKVSC